MMRLTVPDTLVEWRWLFVIHFYWCFLLSISNGVIFVGCLLSFFIGFYLCRLCCEHPQLVMGWVQTSDDAANRKIGFIPQTKKQSSS